MSEILTINEAYRDRLAAAGLGSFDALMHADVGVMVTQRDGRETRRVAIGEGDAATTVYIKRCFRIGPKHSFWPRFRLQRCHTPPIKEAMAIELCKLAEIPTVDVIASGESRRFGLPRAGFVVMTAAPMAWTLNDWLTIGYERPRRICGEERVELMRAVGLIVRQLLASNIYWPDAKAKHIHADLDDNGVWRVCVIDLERARRVARGKGSRGIRSMALTSHGLFTSLSPAPLSDRDIRAFWDAAVSSDRRNAETESLVRELTAQSSDLAGGGSLPRAALAFEHPNRLPMLKSGEMRVDPRYFDLLRVADLSTFDDVMSYSAGASMGKPGLASYRERIRLTLGEGNTAEPVFLKRYRRPPLREQLRRMWEFKLRRGSAEREMHFARHLGILGINTMRRIAFGSRMRGCFEVSGFGITGGVPGESMETLVALWSADAASLPAPSERRDIIEQLAKVAFRLHGNGLFHRDLYLCHVFMSHRDDGGIVLSLIDLGRMIRGGVRLERWRVKDLAALAYSSPSPLVTRADRVRFLYHYVRLEGRGDQKAMRKRVRQLIASINARNRRTARHEVNRRRRLETA